MDLGGPGSQLRVKTEDAPMEGRAESTYRYTVIDTDRRRRSEIQKNVIVAPQARPPEELLSAVDHS